MFKRIRLLIKCTLLAFFIGTPKMVYNLVRKKKFMAAFIALQVNPIIFTAMCAPILIFFGWEIGTITIVTWIITSLTLSIFYPNHDYEHEYAKTKEYLLGFIKIREVL